MITASARTAGTVPGTLSALLITMRDTRGLERLYSVQGAGGKELSTQLAVANARAGSFQDTIAPAPATMRAMMRELLYVPEVAK